MATKLIQNQTEATWYLLPYDRRPALGCRKRRVFLYNQGTESSRSEERQNI